MKQEKFKPPNVMEKLFIIAISFVGIGGFILFYAAIKFPSPFEGPWTVVSAIMGWLIVIVLLILGIQLEGIKRGK